MSGVSNTAMDHDLEDGEISSGSNSDSEMGTSSAADTAAAAAAAAASSQAPGGGGGSGSFSGPAFQSRTAATAASVQQFSSATTYRSTATSSDSDSEDADEEEAAAWRRNKRQKVNNNKLPPPQPPPPHPAAAVPSGGRKVNNIWGSVVQEQSQESVAAELGVFGMEGGVSMASRNVETYNYVLARKMMEKEREEEEMKQGGGGEAAMMLDAELDAYMKGKTSSASSSSDAKRKRPPVKDRLGPRAEMDLKGRYEITENDPEHSVVDEIAYRLQEPKKELIERVVRVIGVKKAIELLGQTATLEENGGVYTVDGSRRRTPGGVYLNLLKNTPSITAKQVRKVFQEESEEKARSKKAAQKRRRHLVAKKMKQAIHTLNLQETRDQQHDEGSRETFHGDTNQALEDVAEEEEEEGEEEEERQPQPAVGIEETPVVYNGTDLEVF